MKSLSKTRREQTDRIKNNRTVLYYDVSAPNRWFALEAFANYVLTCHAE